MTADLIKNRWRNEFLVLFTQMCVEFYFRSQFDKPIATQESLTVGDAHAWPSQHLERCSCGLKCFSFLFLFSSRGTEMRFNYSFI